MDTTKNTVIELIPAIRVILSHNGLKSGAFVPLDQLVETEPEKIAAQLGSSVSILKGEAGEILEELKKSKDDMGEFLFIERLGLLGLSTNHSEITNKLDPVRKTQGENKQTDAAGSPLQYMPLYNKIIAITGGAMGYGEGLARALYAEGANVVIMDINEKVGQNLVEELNGSGLANQSFFVKTDVTSLESVSAAVYETVLAFSGLDVMISNAGVLKAGGIDEMTPENFEFVTRVNYNGYFNCAKASVPVLRAQNSVSDQYYGDIIQINSKSGIEGSRKNFAYSGGKFGGIGITHSLAMDLMPERIKVNAICPGNYFEGPLWAHPETGLFKQYLAAGKVPGAKTIDDVKRHYESMVPAGRGCRVADVVKAIKYVIDQEYETGQAVMVTGGQTMLS